MAGDYILEDVRFFSKPYLVFSVANFSVSIKYNNNRQPVFSLILLGCNGECLRLKTQ